MRDAYYDQLDAIVDDLAAMTQQVEARSAWPPTPCCTADADVAEQVIARDAEIDATRERIEDQAFELLALQQPVAGDLRMLVAALRMVGDLERMGDLSVHVAKIARLRVPEIAVPSTLRADDRADGRRSPSSMVGRVADDHRRAATSTRARALEHADEEMDQLRRRSFRDPARRRLGARRRAGDRHRAARPLLRADRRPRGLAGPPGRLRRHRREPEVSHRVPSTAGRLRTPSGLAYMLSSDTVPEPRSRRACWSGVASTVG